MPWAEGKNHLTKSYAEDPAALLPLVRAQAQPGQALRFSVITKRACGFRTYRAVEVALYHNLGRLPQPDFTHRFC